MNSIEIIEGINHELNRVLISNETSLKEWQQTHLYFYLLNYYCLKGIELKSITTISNLDENKDYSAEKWKAIINLTFKILSDQKKYRLDEYFIYLLNRIIREKVLFLELC